MKVIGSTQAEAVSLMILVAFVKVEKYLLMQPCHFNFLICRFALFCQTVITRDLNRRSLPPKYVSVLRKLLNKLMVYENT